MAETFVGRARVVGVTKYKPPLRENPIGQNWLERFEEEGGVA
jgi:hypothetical protein